ncbi:unnamed protein product [Rotaria socialis]
MTEELHTMASSPSNSESHEYVSNTTAPLLNDESQHEVYNTSSSLSSDESYREVCKPTSSLPSDQPNNKAYNTTPSPPNDEQHEEHINISSSPPNEESYGEDTNTTSPLPNDESHHETYNTMPPPPHDEVHDVANTPRSSLSNDESSEDPFDSTSSLSDDKSHNEVSNTQSKQELTNQSEQLTLTSNHRTFAPLNTPFYRRRQTLTILVWFTMPWICLYISFVLLRCHNWYIVASFIAYLTWMVFFQTFSRRGGLKQQWLRRLEWWTWFAEYFPIHLHKTCELPPDRPYLFGCHPHGIISLGAFCNFATEATGFEEKFPGINLRLLTLKANFRIPFYGLYLSMLGICDASKESCNYILEKSAGNSIILVLGGAKESLDARPSNEYILTLKNRKGFVKIGLANGASLVPVFSFGENDLFDQVPNPQGSKIRKIQIKIQKRLGYATPFFRGRGIFQYAVGFLPNRHAIDTYVGEPIHLPRLARDKITPEIVDKYHGEYMEALKRLFDTYKGKHGNADATIRYVNDNE